MTGVEVRSVRADFHLTQTQFAQLLGVHAVSVCRWETGTPVPLYQAAMIRQFIVAAEHRPRGMDEEVATVLADRGAIAGLYLLLKRSMEPTTPCKRR